MAKIHAKVQKTAHPLDIKDNEPLPYMDPKLHHYISSERRHPLDIGTFLTEHDGDPAIQVHHHVRNNRESSLTIVAIRAFTRNCKIIYLHGYWARSMMMTNASSLMPNVTQFIF